MMRRIKEPFFSFIYDLTKFKKLNYSRYRGAAPNPARLSNSVTIEDVYLKAVDKKMSFFHYLQIPCKITKVRPDNVDFKVSVNHIYYFGHKPVSPILKNTIARNLPRIPWIKKDQVLNLIMAASVSKAPEALMNHNRASSRPFLISKKFFHNVNFLREKIENWVLSSIFLWAAIANNKGNGRETLHVYGIYKWGRRSSNIELRFERALRKGKFKKVNGRKELFLMKRDRKNRFSVIIRLNKEIKEDEPDYDGEAGRMLSETMQNLRYYHS